MRDLTAHELDVLCIICDGRKVSDEEWGAWLTECAESLVKLGLVEKSILYEETEEGRRRSYDWLKNCNVKYTEKGEEKGIPSSIPTGWICPSCSTIYAPSVTVCRCSSPCVAP